MSTVFTSTPGPSAGTEVSCLCESSVGVVFGDIDDAAAFRDAVREGREKIEGCVDVDCADFGPVLVRLEEHPAPRVRVPSPQVGLVFDALGLTPDPDADGDVAGACPAEDFTGRVLTALVLASVTRGVPRRWCRATARGTSMRVARWVGSTPSWATCTRWRSSAPTSTAQSSGSEPGARLGPRTYRA